MARDHGVVHDHRTILPKLILMQAHRHDDAERQNKGYDVARYLAEQQNIRQRHPSGFTYGTIEREYLAYDSMDPRQNHTRSRRKPESTDPVSLNDRSLKSATRACQNISRGRDRRIPAAITVRSAPNAVSNPAVFPINFLVVARGFSRGAKSLEETAGWKIQRSATLSKICPIRKPGCNEISSLKN